MLKLISFRTGHQCYFTNTLAKARVVGNKHQILFTYFVKWDNVRIVFNFQFPIVCIHSGGADRECKISEIRVLFEWSKGGSVFPSHLRNGLVGRKNEQDCWLRWQQVFSSAYLSVSECVCFHRSSCRRKPMEKERDRLQSRRWDGGWWKWWTVRKDRRGKIVDNYHYTRTAALFIRLFGMVFLIDLMFDSRSVETGLGSRGKVQHDWANIVE